MREADSIDLHESITPGVGAGALWSLRGSEDLNASLIGFPIGGGVEST